MATFSKQFLSGGSANGRGIKVAATATPGTTIHTPHATDKDEVWLYAYNGHTSSVVLTVEFGGVSIPDDNITLAIPSKNGLTVVVPGLIITGASNVIKAWTLTTGNVVVITGYVNRIT